MPERVETLYGTIVRHAAERAGHEAVVVDGESLSYRDLLGRVDALRAALVGSGSSLAGNRVYITDVGKLDLLIGVLATIGGGGIAVLAAGGGPAIIEGIACDVPALGKSASGCANVDPESVFIAQGCMNKW